MQQVFRFITEPRFSGYFFAAAISMIYGAAPLAIYWFVDGNPYMLTIGVMTVVASIAILVGFNLPLFDRMISEHKYRVYVPLPLFQAVVWSSFLAFFAVAAFTADAIPLVSAISGQFSAEVLDAQRGAFLKTREGWGASLGYISGVYTGLLLPFALALLFLNWMRGRFGALALFVFYSMSFLQKALFIQVVTPLAYLSARRIIWNYVGLLALIIGSAGLLYMNTALARGVQSQEQIDRITQERQLLENGQQQSPGEASLPPNTALTGRELQHLIPPNFFTANFIPISTTEHLVWRAVAVPIFTASDAIKVFETKFQGRYLLGATSSFIAMIFRLDRVNYDAEVYGHQWGHTEVGRANSFFVTEAYVNFGWIGVVGFSLIAGLAFRVFARSENEAVRSMWILFAYNIIQASLIGTLLSSGFALIFLIALFVRFTPGWSRSSGILEPSVPRA